MDHTSQMAALLSELRRERNGAAADAMSFYGKGYGLNLGVAIHTIRSIIADYPHDHSFAEFLYRQDVRELRIAALWLAEPERVEPSSFEFWQSGITNSEIAEQAAMALLSKVDCIDTLIAEWSASQDVLIVYAALLAASRNAHCNPTGVLQAVEMNAESHPDNRLIARSSVAAAVSLQLRAKDELLELAERLRLKETTTARYIADELAWQIL